VKLKFFFLVRKTEKSINLLISFTDVLQLYCR